MRTNKDTRGQSHFDVFEKQEGQTDVSYNFPEVIRAFHLHKKKDEWWFCIKGKFKVVLNNPLETHYLSSGDKIFIAKDRWHGFQVLGSEPAIMLEYCDKKHDLENPDDCRKPYNEFDGWEIERK